MDVILRPDVPFVLRKTFPSCVPIAMVFIVQNIVCLRVTDVPGYRKQRIVHGGRLLSLLQGHTSLMMNSLLKHLRKLRKNLEGYQEENGRDSQELRSEIWSYRLFL